MESWTYCYKFYSEEVKHKAVNCFSTAEAGALALAHQQEQEMLFLSPLIWSLDTFGQGPRMSVVI